MNVKSLAFLTLSPVEFAADMRSNHCDTGYLVYRNNKLTGSNMFFNNLAEEVSRMPDFAQHEAIFFKLDEETQCLFIVFVHNTTRGQSQGGTRLKHKGYEQFGELIKDGLRLSRGMTEKNSVAGIWWGGGKAIICPLTPEAFKEIDQHKIENRHKIYTNLPLRKKLFSNYGRFVASLNGVYIAAEDMNTTPEDMRTILSACRYVSCLPPEVGGGSNPSIWTARGVFQSMLATIKFYEGKEDLAGKKVSIQGLGNVGFALAEMVLNSGADIVVYDYDAAAYQLVAPYGDRVKPVSAEAIVTEPVDIFAPCAIGGILTPGIIAQLNCKYIAGAANNQLADPAKDYLLLASRGIVYLPDFFINRMGIVNSANEQYGRIESDIEAEVKNIYTDTLALLEECTATKQPTQEVALKWAGEKSTIPHPIWGHRGIQLVDEYLAKQQQ